MASKRDTYKYHFKLHGKIVFSSVTNDLDRREAEHRQRWPEGTIHKVGRRTTRASALRWAEAQRQDHRDTAKGRGPRVVQLQNPITKRWLKLDRWTGTIISHKRTAGPYKHISIAGKDDGT